MSSFLKNNLWKFIFSAKDVHLGTSLRLRKLLQRITYRDTGNIRDLQDFKVHISIAAYNAENWIGETLQAIQNQSFTQWEVYVIDDGSTDNTCEAVKKFSDKDKRIRLYSNTVNSGTNLTRNTALKLAQQDPSWNVFAVVDADDVPYRHWLETGLIGINEGASVVRCINTRCSSDLSQQYYDYMTCAQIFATRQIIETIGFFRLQPFQEDFDYLERLEKAAYLSNSFVVTTPVSCQLMRLHGNNLTAKSKTKEQIASDLLSKKMAQEAKDCKALYVKPTVPAFKRIS